MAQAFLPHLDIHYRKIPIIRRADPPHQIEGQFRAGQEFRLVHVQQDLFLPLHPGQHPDTFRIHRQLIQEQTPLLILDVALQALPQGCHLADIIKQFQYLFLVIHKDLKIHT